MNYACKSKRNFVTNKNISAKRPASSDVKSRRSFIRSHRFEVHVNPSIGVAKVSITRE